MGRVFKISSKIVAGAPAGSLLSLSVMRLGIFHLLMYYLGAIGYFMSASRQKNLSTIYAPLSVEKIMEGHAFARAVRGLLLATGSLATGILEGVQLNGGGTLPYAKPCHLYIQDIEKLNEKRNFGLESGRI